MAYCLRHENLRNDHVIVLSLQRYKIQWPAKFKLKWFSFALGFSMHLAYTVFLF